MSLVFNRRWLLGSGLGLTATAVLAACRANGPAASAGTPALSATDPLPTTIPPGTQLVIAGVSTKLALQISGLIDTIPFKVPNWPNIAAGPDVINAFRANSLDVGNGNAGIPPIQAHELGGIDARIVAVRLTRLPTYVFVTRPHSTVQSTSDFRGKKLAFSQGQAQGVVLLRALKEAGLKTGDVQMVNLTSDQFLTALQAGQVEVAPVGITTVTQYLNQYAKDGAHQIATDVVDLLYILWAPGKVLADRAKAAAIAAFIPIWARQLVWQYEHPEIWVQKYYVENQGISAEQGRAVVAATNKPLFPPNWDEAIAWEQETIELLAQGGYVKPFNANVLFDRRFEALAANAVAETYRS